VTAVYDDLRAWRLVRRPTCPHAGPYDDVRAGGAYDDLRAAGASYGRRCPIRFWRAWAGWLRNGQAQSAQLRTANVATGRLLKLRQGGASRGRRPRSACMRGACVRSARPPLPLPQRRQARPSLQPSTPSFLQGPASAADAYLRGPGWAPRCVGGHAMTPESGLTDCSWSAGSPGPPGSRHGTAILRAGTHAIPRSAPFEAVDRL
jgi:hypothetical protein